MANQTSNFISVASLLLLPVAAQAVAEKPNIVILFVDDWGYNDMGFRNDKFNTPNIDRLAKQSVNFTSAYVPSPTSSPSRVGLFTGRHPLKVGFTRHVSKSEVQFDDKNEFGVMVDDPGMMPNRRFLPLEEVTYGEVLRDAGYDTKFIGKWHLGEERYYPQHQGFNTTYGVSPLGNPVNYYPPYFVRGNVDYQGEYLTDYLTDEAVNIIKNRNGNDAPMLLHYSYYAVHSPHIGKRELETKYEGKGYEPKFVDYLAMVESLDISVGRILTALEQKDMLKNTLFILTSDQGGYFSNLPLRGGKMNAQALFEGGCRVPFFVLNPTGNNNREIDQTISTLDIFPTIMEYAGLDPKSQPQLDGVSLRATIIDDAEINDRPLFLYRSYDELYASVILNNMKYITTRTGKDQMYDLKADPSEQHDLIDDPDYFSEMKTLRKQLMFFILKNEMKTVDTNKLKQYQCEN